MSLEYMKKGFICLLTSISSGHSLIFKQQYLQHARFQVHIAKDIGVPQEAMNSSPPPFDSLFLSYEWFRNAHIVTECIWLFVQAEISYTLRMGLWSK